MTLRNGFGQPLPSLPVYIYVMYDQSPAWAATCTDTVLCAYQPDPNIWIFECNYPYAVRVAKFTDASGRATSTSRKTRRAWARTILRVKPGVRG